ncbi:lasso peptide biosynthesis PqqD family chaperone [Metabacillus halosaccharovorans]|uniref:lasso peptide biosynthesis PqqD family chaperone n=1 Tax=Metabacillus halosaccharovorans TaxID=930124 RepID=UPI003735992D
MVKTLKISTGHIVTQGERNIVSDMDGEKVMLSIENGKYYNLGEMGGEIWDMIQQPISISQLVNTLLAEYEVEKSECEEQVITFLKMLHVEGLIKVEEA